MNENNITTLSFFNQRFTGIYRLYIPIWFHNNYQEKNYNINFEIDDNSLKVKFASSEENPFNEYLELNRNNRFNYELEELYSEFLDYYSESDLQENVAIINFTSLKLNSICRDVADYVKAQKKEYDIYMSYINDIPVGSITFDIHKIFDCDNDMLNNRPHKIIGNYVFFYSVYNDELCRFIPLNNELVNKHFGNANDFLWDTAKENQNKLFDYDLEYIRDINNNVEGYIVKSSSINNMGLFFAEYNPAYDISNEIDKDVYIFNLETNVYDNEQDICYLIPEDKTNLISEFIKYSEKNDLDYMYYTCKNGKNQLLIGKEEILDFLSAKKNTNRDSEIKYSDAGVSSESYKGVLIEKIDNSYFIMYRGKKMEFNDVDICKEFIDNASKSKEAFMNDVPREVIDNVNNYFFNSKTLDNYEVFKVLRASEHPDDSYLYEVIAKHKITKEYAVWTCWNETTHSLNFGHYNIESLSKATDVAKDYFYSLDDSMSVSTSLNK